jgi:hypothetical protein
MGRDEQRRGLFPTPRSMVANVLVKGSQLGDQSSGPFRMGPELPANYRERGENLSWSNTSVEVHCRSKKGDC